jgi:hypothetical protein
LTDTQTEEGAEPSLPTIQLIEREGGAERTEIFIEGQAFLQLYDSAPTPPPLPITAVSKLDRRKTGRLGKRDN